jgi:acyl-CoA reductase-like NAD-dependent aldehyde dehydrogenase
MTDLAQAPSYSRFSRERTPLIAGQALSGERLCPVVRPFDGHVVGRVAEASSSQALVAIDCAVAATERPIARHGRAMILDATAALIEAHAEELAQLLVDEVSKPLKLAGAEVERASTTFRLSGSVARSLSGHVVPVDAVGAGIGKVAFTRMLPVGVVVAITPFNFPLNLVAHKIAPALAAGCPVVLKPAPQAPLSAFALADLMVQAGLPADYLSVIPGTPEEVAKTLVSDDRVAAITFTGSAAAGRQIAAAVPRKRVLLELGNSTPAIVAGDADIERAAAALALSAFSFAGQSCVSVQRIYVEEPAYDDFLGSLLERVDELRVGDPSDPEVTVGPPIDGASAARVRGWIDEAVAGGATLHVGGEMLDGGVLTPAVLSGVPHEASLVQKEVFGPVVSVERTRDLEEAFDRCNGTAHGLQAAIFTGSLSPAFRAFERLQFGGVVVNDAPTFRADNQPYGGVKDSGNTQEGPEYAARAFSTERLMIVEPS